MARGHEIERLKAEIESLRGENGGENRRIQHELALLRAENGKLNVQVEQANGSGSEAEVESIAASWISENQDLVTSWLEEAAAAVG